MHRFVINSPPLSPEQLRQLRETMPGVWETMLRQRTSIGWPSNAWSCEANVRVWLSANVKSMYYLEKFNAGERVSSSHRGFEVWFEDQAERAMFVLAFSDMPC